MKPRIIERLLFFLSNAMLASLEQSRGRGKGPNIPDMVKTVAQQISVTENELSQAVREMSVIKMLVEITRQETIEAYLSLRAETSIVLS
jgi:hypothetical protein